MQAVMEDFLSDERLREPPYTESCGFSVGDIRNAVLCLQLNPNAYWARLVLIQYAYPRAFAGSLDDMAALAVISRTAHRLGRCIYKYNRRESRLHGFIARVHKWSLKDVYAEMARKTPHDFASGSVATAEPARGPRKASSSNTLYDKDLADMPTIPRKRLAADVFINKWSQLVLGDRIDRLRQRKDLDNPKNLAFIILDISPQELQTAIETCEAKGTSVFSGLDIPDRQLNQGELIRIINAFHLWNASVAYGQAFTDEEKIVYRIYYADKIKEKNMLAAASEEQGVNCSPGTAKNIAHNKFRKDFRRFLSDCEMDRKDIWAFAPDEVAKIEAMAQTIAARKRESEPKESPADSPHGAISANSRRRQ